MVPTHRKLPHIVLEKTRDKKTYKVTSCSAKKLCNKVEPSPQDCGRLETESKSWLFCPWFWLSCQNHCLVFDKIIYLIAKKYHCQVKVLQLKTGCPLKRLFEVKLQNYSSAKLLNLQNYISAKLWGLKVIFKVRITERASIKIQVPSTWIQI
jgi:hypothetical protein